MAAQNAVLTRLHAGMVVPFGGDRFTRVEPLLAAAFKAGDALVVCQSDGELLRIEAETRHAVADAIEAAGKALSQIAMAPPADIKLFFDAFARRLGKDEIWLAIRQANHGDIAAARHLGRGVGRLELSGDVRQTMIDGLRAWAALAMRPEKALTVVDHGTWSVEARQAPIGTIGFVFEGRPNVLVDACGVLASRNSAVLRIGRAAARTAEAILRLALQPALAEAGLPLASVLLLPSLGRDAAWAMFTDRRLALAVARGSGAAVRRLGDLASQSGIPASLHGTGGAWLLADHSASPERFGAVVEASLDRKVCNTLNTCLIVRSRAEELVPVFVDSLAAAARRFGRQGRLHILEGSEHYLFKMFFALKVPVDRGGEDVSEPFTTPIALSELSTEWEWEQTPEVTLAVVDDLHDGIELINRYSPHFVASLVAEDPAAHQLFYDLVKAPFVGDGFTRWVDGQYALDEPELGLSNWQFGRPLGRASVLTGSSVHTVRLRMRQADPALQR